MIDKILQLEGEALEIQKIQTDHRLKLIDFWNIKEGSKVLEIGCGQGDTLVALAFVVGENGFVHGVDIASENYGAPETLGQARQRLMKSEIGNNIKIDFNFDVMKEECEFLENEFDYIVLSHCIWYLSDYDELVNILKKIKPWGKQLCLAEWDPCVDKPEQLNHLKAVTIQATCESFKMHTISNVRTMIYPSEIEKATIESGWIVTDTTSIYSPQMQDGKWEVNTAINLYPDAINQLDNMPNKLKSLLLAQIEELKSNRGNKPMGVFGLVAKK